MPGRNPACQFCDSWIGYPPGHIAMKPGRFWFTVPRPYVSHEPMLGRTSRASPQFISSSDGSWFGTSAYIERMTQMSSMLSAVLAKRSETSMPLFPYFWNLNGDG